MIFHFQLKTILSAFSSVRITTSIGVYHHPEPRQGVPRPAEAFVLWPYCVEKKGKRTFYSPFPFMPSIINHFKSME